MNGDIASKVSRVLRECAQLKYPKPIDEVGLRMGDPVVLLPILHFVLLKFSRHVALCIHKAGYELHGKTDQKFVENAFRLFRDCFSIKTVLTPAHFLEQGFAERKLILVSEVVQACKKIHNDEIRKERLAALKTKQGPGVESRLYEPARKTPEIKVVKNGVETRQVVRAQHLQNATDGGQSLFKVKKTISSPQGANAQVTALKDSVPSPQNRSADLPLRSPRTSPLSLRSPTAGARAAVPPPAPAPQTTPPHAPFEASPPAWADITLKPSGIAAALSTPIHSWFMNPTFHDPHQPLHSPDSTTIIPATANGGQGWLGEGEAPAKQLFGGTLGGGAAAWLGAAAQPPQGHSNIKEGLQPKRLTTAQPQAPQTPEPQEGGAAAAPGVRGGQHTTEGLGQGRAWDPPGSFAFFRTQPVQQPAGTGTGGAPNSDGAAAREAQRVEALTSSFLRGGWDFVDGLGGNHTAAGAGGAFADGLASSKAAAGVDRALEKGWQGVGVHDVREGAGDGDVEADWLSESHVEPSLHVGVGGDGDGVEDQEPWGSHGTAATGPGADALGEGAWPPPNNQEAGKGIIHDWEREGALAGGLGVQDDGHSRDEGGVLQGVSSWVPGQQEQQLQQLQPQQQQQQTLASLQRQLEEMRARLEQVDRQAEHARAQAERSAMESEALHAQRAAALEALQARTTVLEGRVRYLECELQVCVRRGEYDPHPHLASVARDLQLAEGSGSPPGGAQELGALHSHVGHHNALLGSQPQQQHQQHDLSTPNPVQSTPGLTEPAAWTEPPPLTSISHNNPHSSTILSPYPPPPPLTANSHTARTEAAATRQSTPWPHATPSLHSVPSLPSASLASPLPATQASGHTSGLGSEGHHLGSKAARQLWQGSSLSGSSTSAQAPAATTAVAAPLLQQGSSTRPPLNWQHDLQQAHPLQQRSSTSSSSAGPSWMGSSAPRPVTPSLLAPMPSFSFQPSVPELGMEQAEQQPPPLIAPPTSHTASPALYTAPAATYTAPAATYADQQQGLSGVASAHGELQVSPPQAPPSPYLIRDRAGLQGAGVEVSGHKVTVGTPSTVTPGTSSMQPPASMPSVAAGTSGTARASYSSTSDLISSLYSRYTEAQSFLSALKSSKRGAA